jgi:methionyl-tRNA formyltransferase
VKHRFSSLAQHITTPKKKRLVFLGTPDVSAQSLQMLATACSSESANDNHADRNEMSVKDRNEMSVNYEIVAVVTQPPAPAGRNLKLLPSPVQLLAEKLRIPCLTPPSAKDPTFLQVSRPVRVSVCM